MAACPPNARMDLPEVAIALNDSSSLLSLHRLADAAHRIRAMLHAAEALTEQHTLSSQDRMALDGLLLVGRECTEELIWRIDQLSTQSSAGKAVV